MDPVYLDYAATTPMRDEVREAMWPYFGGVFGNPSSTHRWGREAAAALAEARSTCAEMLGARFPEIHFVRGGTESDNLAVGGRIGRLRAEGHTPTVIVSSIEHKAVLDAAKHLTARGAGRLVVVTVRPDGAFDFDALDHALAVSPAVVSTMWVNNETGLILPVPEIAARAAGAGATFHTDAVQAVGKVPVRVDQAPVDLLTVTGHKIYGPKGTGLLFVREGTQLDPTLHGGRQERALRPGTEDVAGAVGLAAALRLAVTERDDEVARLTSLRDTLEHRLRSAIPDLRINAGDAPRAPHVCSIGVAGLDGTSLLMSLDLEGVAASGGSACQSGSTGGSHVIAALYGREEAHATVRFSLGRGTTAAHVDRAATVTAAVVTRLRGGAAA